MGNWLQAYGQSDATKNINSVANMMVESGKAVNDMRRNDLRDAYTQQAMDIQGAEEARKVKVDAEQQAQLDKTIDITVHPTYLSLPDDQKAAVLKYFSDSGYTDVTGKGKTRDILAGTAAIEKSKPLFTDFMAPVVQGKKQAVLTSWSALQDAMATGDQKKIETATSDYQKTKMAYQASSDKFDEHLNKLDLEMAKQTGKVVKGPGGGLYQKDEQGNMVELVAPGEPRSPSQIELEIKAAQGDALAIKVIKEQESRKARLKQIEAGTGGAGTGGGPYIPNAPVGTPGERNEGALKGLTANEAATVKGLVDYRVAPLSGFVLKSPWGQKMIGAAQMYDPSFDYTQYVSRQKAKNDFTSGKAAVNLRALNTAVYHLDTLDKKLAALNNSDFPLYNEIANRAITATGDKRVTGAQGAVTAVVSELAAVFKGMGATDQEINAWRNNFPIAGSRAQQKEAVNTGIELMFGRVKALESQYEGAMGRQKDFRFLSPESRKILKGLGADVDSIDEVAGTGTRNGGGAQAASGAPPPGGVDLRKFWK